MGLPLVWCTTYIISLDQCYIRLERSITSSTMIRRHLLHMGHHLDLRCHPLQFVCSPFEVEVEEELIGEVVVRMVGKVVVEMVREVVVNLSRHCLLPYPPLILTHHPILLYPHTLTHHLPYLQTLTHLYHLRCCQSQPP